MFDDELYELAKELVSCYDEAYNIYESQVRMIIANKIENINLIERTLDYIMDIYTDKGFYLFIKLLLYYQTVNENNAKKYLEILKEYRKEEYQSFVKKITK